MLRFWESYWSRTKKVGLILGILASAITIIVGFRSYFYDSHTTSEINVTSHNQQGGITAGKIYIGEARHKFTDSEGRKLITEISKHTFNAIHVMAVMGNENAHSFAGEIVNFLRKRGYRVMGVDTALSSRSGISVMEPNAQGNLGIIVGRLD